MSGEPQRSKMSGDNEYHLKILDNRQTTFLIQTYRVTILKQFTTRPLLTGSSRAQAKHILNSRGYRKQEILMENKQLKDLIAKVQRWFYDRNLQTQDPNKQF